MKIVQGLVPVKRTVHRKGKTFTQTFYVRSNNEVDEKPKDYSKLDEFAYTYRKNGADTIEKQKKFYDLFRDYELDDDYELQSHLLYIFSEHIKYKYKQVTFEKLFEVLNKFLEENDPRKKVINLKVGSFSIKDIVSLHKWITYQYTQIRYNIKEFDEDKSTKLKKDSKAILSMVKPIKKQKVIFRGTQDFYKWLNAPIGAEIPLGVASFSTEPRVAFDFSKNDRTSIVPLLVYLSDSIQGIDIKSIKEELEQNYRYNTLESVHGVFKDSVLRDFIYQHPREKEIVLRERKVKIVDKIDDYKKLIDNYPQLEKYSSEFFRLSNRSKIRFIVLKGVS